MLIGKKAPHFKATAVQQQKIIENFSLDLFANQYVILFFYPLDFTFVCPTELHAFEAQCDEFKSRGVEIVGCSVDSHYSHLAWLNTPKEKGGIQGVSYPLIADITKNISRQYHVLFEEEGIAFRGLYLLDKNHIIRHQLINDLPLGRSVDEAIRMLDALICFEKNGEVCPANWHKGDKTMKPTSKGVCEYFEK